MALKTATTEKILHLGGRLVNNRLLSALRLGPSDFSREQLRAAGAQTFLTLAMVTGVTVILFIANEFIDLRHEIVFYFVPIMIAMLRWSVLQGFVATAAAAFYANLFFYAPILNYYSNNPKRIIGLFFFIVALVIIGYLAANLRNARRASSVPIVPMRANAAPEVDTSPAAAAADLTAPARAQTVPERVKDFLLTREGEMLCDSCIQENLGLKWRQQVQLITATLGVTRDYKRDLAKCCGCQEIKQATQAIAS
jgi:Domain of unknown function (DUF4118)